MDRKTKPAPDTTLTVDQVIAALPTPCSKIYGDYERGYNKALEHATEKILALLSDDAKES